MTPADIIRSQLGVTPADIIRRHKLGDDFDIDGVTYRIVLLHFLASKFGDDHCDKCPAGGVRKCLVGRFHACRQPPGPRVGARFVVPVSEVPALAAKGLLV